MKRYYLDTNVFVRLVLNDNANLYQKAITWFQEAKDGEIEIYLVKEILVEIEYVLHKNYQFSRIELFNVLSSLIGTGGVVVEEPYSIHKALDLYSRTTIDLVDLLLFSQAHYMGAEILSFDKDFRKL